MEQKKMNNKGFSLVELIIVIAIMAILVGVLAPQFIKYIESSRQSTDIQSASAVRSAIEAAVAEGTIDSDVTVSTDASGDINISGPSDIDDILEDVGLNDTISCKSSGWPVSKTIASYSVSSYSWTPNATATDTTNGNKPNKNIADAFQ